MSSLFAEENYYELLLVNELKEQYNDITVCFDLFVKLMHEGINRIWINIRDSKGGLINSYFVNNLVDVKWNVWVATDYFKRGFYNKYYVVNCMRVIDYQRWRKKCEMIAKATEKQRQEQKRVEELKKLFGKQYNMFGGMD